MSKRSRCNTCGHTPGRRARPVVTPDAPPPCTCHCHSEAAITPQGPPEARTAPPEAIREASKLVVPELSPLARSLLAPVRLRRPR